MKSGMCLAKGHHLTMMVVDLVDQSREYKRLCNDELVFPFHK